MGVSSDFPESGQKPKARACSSASMAYRHGWMDGVSIVRNRKRGFFSDRLRCRFFGVISSGFRSPTPVLALEDLKKVSGIRQFRGEISSFFVPVFCSFRSDLKDDDFDRSIKIPSFFCRLECRIGPTRIVSVFFRWCYQLRIFHCQKG